MTKFGIYSGEDFLNLKLEPRKWVIENIIRERDSMMLVGNEKSGKSLLTQQMVFSLTSSQPFLDRWEVSKKYKVSYIQLEGELSDTQDRYKRMRTTMEFEPENFQLLFYPPLELHIRGEMLRLKDSVKEFKPDIVIIDSLYFAFSGSLSDDAIVRKFIGNIRIFKDSLNCTVIIVHHTHKLRLKPDGSPILEGDEAIFGTKFLKAYPDHIMMFTHNKTNNIRVLSCDTQRSGDILKQCNLKLVQPTPLYFEEETRQPSKASLVLDLLSQTDYKEGLSADQITTILNIPRSTFFHSIKETLDKTLIVKDDSKRPVIYRIK